MTIENNGFREMRRKRQQLSDAACVRIMERATSGTLSLLGDGGYPYGVPVSFVHADGRLYFHSALKGHKVDAVRNYDKASFCVIDKDEIHGDEYTTYFRSVIAFGRIHVVEDEEESRAAAAMLGNRYYPGQDESLRDELAKSFRHMLVIRFDIEHMTGKEAIELVRMKKKKTEG